MRKIIQSEKVRVIISFILFLIALTYRFDNVWINNTLYIISYLLVGLEVLKNACLNIIKGKILDESFLMSVATLGAFLIGELPEAVAVMMFYQVGELFQDYAVDKSKKSIKELMNIRADYANIYENGKIKKVNPKEVKIGSTIIVSPGEKIPLDGEIIEGNSSLDTKALTGESIPKDVFCGNNVLSGCINLNGVIKIKVTKEFGESTVSKIIDLVENVSNKKSKSEKFITKFAKYYTPIVVIIAIILGCIIPFLIKDSYSNWIYRALSFLVVSCPCALVISIPLSFFGGIGGASKIGVLIKGSNYLEMLSKVDTILFDKTGTLTKGIFDIQKINPIGISKDKLLEMVAYAENYSNHPVADAIKKAYTKKIDEKKIKDIKEIPGLGIKAKIGKQLVLVGNKKLMQEENINFIECDDIGTILYVAIDKNYCGYILIADEIKDDSKTAIKELKSNGIKQTIMLTGDKRVVALDVSKKLGIDLSYFELLPQDKAKKVEEILNNKSSNSIVAFVGDGINDAPVLALADIGIAMGMVGADSAIEASDVVIMTDELSKIVSAMKISKKTIRIVKENIIFAIFIKIAVLILAALGISSMWQAVFADVGVSIIAVLNALRVLIIKDKMMFEKCLTCRHTSK